MPKPDTKNLDNNFPMGVNIANGITVQNVIDAAGREGKRGAQYSVNWQIPNSQIWYRSVITNFVNNDGEGEPFYSVRNFMGGNSDLVKKDKISKVDWATIAIDDTSVVTDEMGNKTDITPGEGITLRGWPTEGDFGPDKSLGLWLSQYNRGVVFHKWDTDDKYEKDRIKWVTSKSPEASNGGPPAADDDKGGGGLGGGEAKAGDKGAGGEAAGDDLGGGRRRRRKRRKSRKKKSKKSKRKSKGKKRKTKKKRKKSKSRKKRKSRKRRR